LKSLGAVHTSIDRSIDSTTRSAVHSNPAAPQLRRLRAAWEELVANRIVRLARRLVPASVREAARVWIRSAARPAPAELLATLHDPWTGTTTGGPGDHAYYFRDPIRLRCAASENALPVPPDGWRQGYYVGDEAGYLASGEVAAEYLRDVLRDHGVVLGPGDAAMDWGCASGRVLRHFAREARQAELWGVDLDARLVAWAKENLSPPFHFVTGSAYPHLPFEDRKFKFIYAFSVFTHIEHLQDMWLMELNRVMDRGGIGVFSVHNEYTLDLMRHDDAGKSLRRWLPAGLEVDEIARHEVTIVSRKEWEPTLTFFSSDWIRREWGRYFEVLEIRAAPAGSKQPSAVLRKR
jgi:ubiquinone/menaquinone biosynthesis C-methylase UbiE